MLFHMPNHQLSISVFHMCCKIPRFITLACYYWVIYTSYVLAKCTFLLYMLWIHGDTQFGPFFHFFVLFSFYHYTNTVHRKVGESRVESCTSFVILKLRKTGAGCSKTSSSTQEAIEFSVCTEVSVNISLQSNLTSRYTVAGTYSHTSQGAASNGSLIEEHLLYQATGFLSTPSSFL